MLVQHNAGPCSAPGGIKQRDYLILDVCQRGVTADGPADYWMQATSSNGDLLFQVYPDGNCTGNSTRAHTLPWEAGSLSCQDLQPGTADVGM